MLERIVESWLTKANERSLEIPFCQLLASEGHSIIHLSRHGPFEQGKDILTVDAEGVPSAFQLKSIDHRLTQRQWESYVPQIRRLVEIPIKHPSIDENAPRRVFFVVNGELSEDVREEIAGRNVGWRNASYPELEVIVGGEILSRLKSLQTDFWPSRLSFERDLLQLFLADGSSPLDKPEFAGFVQSLLPFDEEPQPMEAGRALASAAIFTAYALSGYGASSNHVALLEGWMIFTASLISFVEKHGISADFWGDSFEISLFAVESSLGDLIDELAERVHLVEGNALVDAPFYRGRVTWLVGLVSAAFLYSKSRGIEFGGAEWMTDFVDNHLQEMQLWGEAAYPQFLAFFWYLEQIEPSKRTVPWLFQMLQSVCQYNDEEFPIELPDPYHNLPEVISASMGLSERKEREHYKGRSYSILGIVELIARRGWRQTLSLSWPAVSKIAFAEFIPDQPWQYCLWHCDEGSLQVSMPETPQSWAELRDAARECDHSILPNILKDHPSLLLLFLIVYPHRAISEVVKFLDDSFKELQRVSRSAE